INDSAKGVNAKTTYLELSSIPEVEGLFQRLSNFLGSILTGTDTPRTAVFGKEETPEHQIVSELIETSLAELVALRPLLELQEQFSTNSAKPDYIHLRNIFVLYQRVTESYIQEKTNFGFLDHDDLIDQCVKLFSQQEVAKEIAATFKVCFIDEYQDTDERQYQLLHYLTDQFRNHVTATVVGDPKQSIYRFREANLEVFGQTVLEILASTNEDKAITLSESFRMLPFPLAVINQVTDTLFETTKEKYYYTPLIKGRPDAILGEVAVLLSHKPSEEKPQEFDSEELLIAKAIKKLNTEDTSLKQIAILIRNRSKLPMLELQLKLYDIPYTVCGGVGFYQQQEVIDLISFLRFLIDPTDTLSLVAILRSPYVGFNDLELWNITHHYQQLRLTTSLWDFLLSEQAELSEPQQKRFSLLKDLLPMAGRTSTDELLRALIAKSGIELVYYSFSDGGQKVSNIKKLIDLASRNDISIWEFVEQCTLFQDRSEREQQAEAEPTDDAVRIMTVHASKGLQFHTVFLPYLAEQKKGSINSSFLSRTLPHIRLESLDASGEAVKHPITILNKLHEDAESIEEEKRIFYVAMTRAENNLYLSATLEKDKIPTDTPFAWFCQSFGLTSADLTSLPSFPINRLITEYDSTATLYSQAVIEETIPIIKTIDVNTELSKQEIKEDLSTYEIDLSIITPDQGITRYSPTQLLAYLQCPTKYYLRYKLGIPEETPISIEHDNADHSEHIQATLYGQLLHRTFEKIERIVEDGVILPLLLSEIFEQIRAEFHINEQEARKYYDQLVKQTELFQSSELFKSILNAKASFAEIPLRYAFEQKLMLSGIVDRLFEDSEGIWNIIDYKTSSNLNEKNVENYIFQLRFYCYLILKLYNVEKVKGHLYFSTTGRTISITITQDQIQEIHSLLDTTVSSILTDIHSGSIRSLVHNRDHCKDCEYSVNKTTVCISDKIVN
ncbi:MAG TPA: 3'-5' exonuclease, partial [Candidatus Kapabacteria bacterium]|nr:3'-5' exonuclease [Candidatus Kapabacteria bacterium]